VPATLLRGGHVYTTVDPFATAMLIIDGNIRWIGSDAGADVHRDSADEVIELDGALVTPAFVDAHIHTTAYGLLRIGLDLSQVTDRGQALDMVVEYRTRSQPVSTAHYSDALIWGQGWDETAWSDPQFPSLSDWDSAARGRPMYLARVDAHSAFVSSAMLDLVPGVRELPGWNPDGFVAQEAHAAIRSAAFQRLSPDQRAAAQRATLDHAATMGIACVHEMAGPTISSEEDLRILLEWTQDASTVEVLGYWGALGEWDIARELGALGCAGDLFVDGSVGSHTACLREPYSDTNTAGASYIDVASVAEHIVDGTRAQMQAGFHVIGDGALDIVSEGFRKALEQVSPEHMRLARHRLEHAEMLHDEHIAQCSDLDITLSMQPLFDALWGSEGGMYEQRLGAMRAHNMNPFSRVTRSGVALALGSDAPVSALDPWASIQAAVFPHNRESGISVRAAFAAHTRGGRRGARQESVEPGVLREDAPATYAIWQATDLVVQAPDARLAAWSTDARSGTPGLPDVSPGSPLPRALRTVRAGTTIFDGGAL
jgi:predicted amidohydrolase YtcJ